MTDQNDKNTPKTPDPNPSRRFPFLYVTIPPHFSSQLHLQAFVLDLAEAHNKLAALMIAHMHDHVDPIDLPKPSNTNLPLKNQTSNKIVGMRSMRNVPVQSTCSDDEVMRSGRMISTTPSFEQVERTCCVCHSEFEDGEMPVIVPIQGQPNAPIKLRHNGCYAIGGEIVEANRLQYTKETHFANLSPIDVAIKRPYEAPAAVKHNIPPGKRCPVCMREFEIGQDIVLNDNKAWQHLACPLPPNDGEAIADIFKFMHRAQSIVHETMSGPLDLDKLAGMNYMDQRGFLVQFGFYCKCVAPKPNGSEHGGPFAEHIGPFGVCGECKRPIIEDEKE